MERELILKLLAPPPRKSRTGGKSYALLDNGDKVPLSSLSVETLGSFQGKAGTMRRSRKGRTYRQANGSRFYCPNYTGVRVLAYKA